MLRRRPATASSFHLWWDLPRGARHPIVEVSATVEVLTAPVVHHLYFWALQVSFLDERRRRLGAAHTGLQWHPSELGGAVNWGGYHEGGGELAGSPGALPPVDSANTMRWPWQPNRPYRFRVSTPNPGTWRSEVTDLADGRHQVLRELFVEASALAEPVCWTEVFAPCDAPSATARWSDLLVVDDGGGVTVPTQLRPTYQAETVGGCANTESRPDPDGGALQTTGLRAKRERERTSPIAWVEPFH